MNGITKESYLKATPELKDEMMFDLILGLHKKIDDHIDLCPVKKSLNRLWAYSIGLPGVIGTIIAIIKVIK